MEVVRIEQPVRVKLAAVKQQLWHPLVPTQRHIDRDNVMQKMSDEHCQTSLILTPEIRQVLLENASKERQSYLYGKSEESSDRFVKERNKWNERFKASLPMVHSKSAYQEMNFSSRLQWAWQMHPAINLPPPNVCSTKRVYPSGELGAFRQSTTYNMNRAWRP
ncbi:hypothetical protein Ciccas_011201 [Cichlidogyrus casuarinus]|uniref:Uncharacterized protein n=1 Tax=Cichlidogyrus casuarinus TaxID=1844966 RepID=A0ABD2PWN7_9PLAT